MADPYQVITDRIIQQLEVGVVPWRKTWTTGAHGWRPRNLTSNRAYNGCNVFLLACQSYPLPFWVTFKQARELGGNVRKGQKATPVLFAGVAEDKKRTDENGDPVKYRCCRYYSVFNVDQCDGLGEKIPHVEGEPEREPFEPIEAAERIVAGLPDAPEILTGGGPSYHPRTDTVNMPPGERFETDADYYATLFHELSHATGHESRLDREGIRGGTFGDQIYGTEELIAEMSAAYLCAESGIEQQTLENQTAYVQGWMNKLRTDNRLVVTAAAQAQKSADYILSRTAVESGVANV